MKKERKESVSKCLAFAALFAALCTVGTYVIVIPLPNGYFNVGDVFVLLAGWCLGAFYGGLAAAVGSGLADLISGYAIYAPATFFIKGMVAVSAYYLYRLFKKCITNDKVDFVPRLLSALIAETVMFVGYFLFECALYGAAAGIVALPGNLMQGGICAVGGTLLVCALYPVRSVKKLFIRLYS